MTMVELAGRIGCSLRTLYLVAPTKDELVVTAVDRHLWRTGRRAMASVAPDLGPVAALRAYLAAASTAVHGTTAAFASDLIAVPAARRIVDDHSDYLESVVQELLKAGIEAGEIRSVDTVAFARILAGAGREFALPSVMDRIASSPKEAADAVVDALLRGLKIDGSTR